MFLKNTSLYHYIVCLAEGKERTCYSREREQIKKKPLFKWTDEVSGESGLLDVCVLLS